MKIKSVAFDIENYLKQNLFNDQQNKSILNFGNVNDQKRSL